MSQSQDSSRYSGNCSARTPSASTQPALGTKHEEPAKDAGASSTDCSADRPANVILVDFQAGLSVRDRLKILAMRVSR
jgi:hypothetical protein